MAKVEPLKHDAFESENGPRIDSSVAGEERFNKLLSKFSVSPWLLDPRSRRMRNWDALVALALVYTATVTPYEVAFLDTKPGPKVDTNLSAFPIYVFNVLIDVIFFTDMCFNFNLIYYDRAYPPLPCLRLAVR